MFCWARSALLHLHTVEYTLVVYQILLICLQDFVQNYAALLPNGKRSTREDVDVFLTSMDSNTTYKNFQVGKSKVCAPRLAAFRHLFFCVCAEKLLKCSSLLLCLFFLFQAVIRYEFFFTSTKILDSQCTTSFSHKFMKNLFCNLKERKKRSLIAQLLLYWWQDSSVVGRLAKD